MATSPTLRAVSKEQVTKLREALRGQTILPEEPGYDEARTIWNAMIDKHPAIIARCEGAADVITCVNFARENDAPLAVKGGGHNVAGNSIVDGGIVIDLSPMSAVRIDPAAQTARAAAGAKLGDLDHEAQAFDLATPAGFHSTTGLAGLTLGGGFGWLSRKYGMTVDNLRSVDIVTADGQLRHASEEENPDLFWGVRGGGGNFGVVTSFEFDLHEVGPEILAGVIAYESADAHDVVRRWRDFVMDIPDALTVWVIVLKAPPFPWIPEEHHGEEIAAVVPVYAGDAEEGNKLIEPLRSLADPIADNVAPRPYVEWQQFFDKAYTAGARNYWKSLNFPAFTDDTIDTCLEYALERPSAPTKFAMVHLGGATTRIPQEAMAYPHRDAEFVVNIVARWTEPQHDDACIAWARDAHDALTEHSTEGTYVNFISEETGEEAFAYRGNHDELVEIKNKYDPENLFQGNQNIQPT